MTRLSDGRALVVVGAIGGGFAGGDLFEGDGEGAAVVAEFHEWVLWVVVAHDVGVKWRFHGPRGGEGVTGAAGANNARLRLEGEGAESVIELTTVRTHLSEGGSIGSRASPLRRHGPQSTRCGARRKRLGSGLPF